MNHNRERGGDPIQVNDALQESLAKLSASIQERKSNVAAALEPPPTPNKSGKSSLREPPEGDAQADFFVPSSMTWPARIAAPSWTWLCSGCRRKRSGLMM